MQRWERIMAFIYCSKCDWQQDDFYSEHYNPAKSLKCWDRDIFGDRRDKLDESFSDDAQFLKDNGDISKREVIAREYEKFANRIRKMRWITYEDWKKDYDAGTAKCPDCGCSDSFGID